MSALNIAMAYKGFYKPQHPEKYLGDVSNVVYRSGWERRFMVYCDTTPGVLRWASEEIIIPYVSPLDGRMHRYFPDFYLEVQSSTGKRAFLIEVKPKKQSVMPTPRRQTRKYLNEVATVAVNQAKWQAASEYCRERGWTFQVLTEDHLFDRKR